MKVNLINKLFHRKLMKLVFYVLAAILVIYLIGAIYFTKHFFFHTVINGVNVSLKAHGDAELIIKDYLKDYKLSMIERKNEVEEITAQDIGMKINSRWDKKEVYQKQNPFLWVGSIFRDQKNYVHNLYLYNRAKLELKSRELCCINQDFIEPQNVSFTYSNGTYDVKEAVFGNKLDKQKLYETIRSSVLKGERIINLDEKACYENPKYTLSSKKTLQTRSLLNHYVSTVITYKLGGNTITLDGNVIHTWLIVNDNLEVSIEKTAVVDYVKELAVLCDTVGTIRKFQSSVGKIVEVKGGLYGWKINKDAEVNSIINSVTEGEKISREPIYSRRALYRDDNDIGDTYVEINITKQHIWFYKEGKLIAEGSVVTGNPNRGNATVMGTYMITYKQNIATLKGIDYEVEVTYWMPFYGNMGIHDARWRSAFGGEIYKTKGTHGCVNTPYYVAKKIFENIEEGIPVVVYEEEDK